MIDLSALVQYGAVGILAASALYAVKLLFDSWRRGELLPRAIWERSEARADTLALQLQRNTEAIEANTKAMGDGFAKLLEALERHR